MFAGFLSDFDPSLIFIVTYDANLQTSYLKILKIDKNEEVMERDRGYSFAEENDKQDLIESVKTNLLESNVQRRVPFSTENVQVTVDTEKQKMKVAKRGLASIDIN